MIKLIALDIDGTLLGSRKKVTKQNIQAIKAAREQDIKICIATGRSASRVEPIAREIGIIDNNEYIICLNGGGIYQYDKDKKLQKIKETLFSIDDVKYIYDNAVENKINCFSYNEDPKSTYVIKNRGAFIWFMKKISGRKAFVYDNQKTDQKAYKVIAYGKKKNILAAKPKFAAKNYEMFSWSYVSNKTMNIEISPVGVDKLYALQEVSKIYNIKQEEVMYFGDGDNDKRAIEWAGVGVAMKNAASHIKEAASHTTGHHKKSGVAQKINEIILNK
ncbi:Cof-type HAD-IIB family hydrolase [Spiroplasma culicicola]|uniref:HAD superfamily hydrolase n=1 Tax=Spiroplasma culicicola AES-1 TaxID=1276246 RepID=W6AFL9_9MOLU|nr:HAD family hydrolase [Spiroplasma culicicola]AHI52489.1 HAD superfamily hydrolase [Spiroplasma culicicola AES-1]